MKKVRSRLNRFYFFIKPWIPVILLLLSDVILVFLRFPVHHPVRLFLMLISTGVGLYYLWKWLTSDSADSPYEMGTLTLLFLFLTKVLEFLTVPFPWVLVAESILFLLLFLYRPIHSCLIAWLYLLFFNYANNPGPLWSMPFLFAVLWMLFWLLLIFITQQKIHLLVHRVMDLASELTRLRSGSAWFMKKPATDIKQTAELALEWTARSGDLYSMFEKWWLSSLKIFGPIIGLNSSALYLIDENGEAHHITSINLEGENPGWTMRFHVHERQVIECLQNFEPFMAPANWLHRTDDRWMKNPPLHAETFFVTPIDTPDKSTVVWCGLILTQMNPTIRQTHDWLRELFHTLAELFHTSGAQKNRLDVLTRLNHFAFQMAQDLSVNDVLQHFIKTIKHFVPSDGGLIALVHHDNPEDMTLFWSEGIEENKSRLKRYPRRPDKTSWARWIIQHRDEIIRVEQKLHKKDLPIWSAQGPHPQWSVFLGIPLKVHGEPVGLTILGRKEDDFHAEEIQWLSILSTAAALAFRNAQLYERIRYQAERDGLTGLYNHRVFQEKLESYLENAKRENATFKEISLLLLDIDHFKQMNDTYGHPFGDQVLKRVAGAIQENVRSYDVVARYGGEEFAIILPGCNAITAMKVADEIRQAISRIDFKKGLNQIQVTVSGGIATFPSDARERAELLERADIALYHAKRNGRNQIWHWQDLPPTTPTPETGSSQLNGESLWQRLKQIFKPRP